ncbi:hypothetical protein DL771_002663 [Monosporascus sp. 5C6A]|nr:hypothetical protein DL771_002663 [Monosporascus sp. 5C6A]
MTMYSEPVAMDRKNWTPPQQEDGLQYIHTRLVRSERGLCKLLADKYGHENYKIEMRHNVYRIKLSSGCDALNLV